MSETHLILQVLGTNDLHIGEEESLLETIEVDYELEAIEQEIESHHDSSRISLPLVETIIEHYYQNEQTKSTRLIFGIILSDQRQWAKKTSSTWGDDSNWQIIAKDGIWHQEFLDEWFAARYEQYGETIFYFPIPLEIDSSVKHGVADWEKMATKIEPLLSQVIVKQNSNQYKLISQLQNQSATIDKIDKIIIQHSSGTPALTSALYLWGIKQKLGETYLDTQDNETVKFVYISELKLDDESNYIEEDSGDYWQWQLRLPIVKELIGIQDFSGAMKLIEQAPKGLILQSIKDELNYLNLSVDFNLQERDGEACAKDEEAVKERIAIALWSEASFRDRGHWMHWYLRIAGALELALLLLVQVRGNNRYKWQNKKLIFDDDKNRAINKKKSIDKIVRELLTNGRFSQEYEPYEVEKIEDSNWNNFQEFYSNNWLDIGLNMGFIATRNYLYHQLLGDEIDQKLNNNNEAAEKVIDWLTDKTYETA